MARKNLGSILVDKKIISPEQLQEILLSQKGSTDRLGEILVKKGFASEDKVLAALGEFYGLKVQLHLDFDDPEDTFATIPVHFLNKNRIAPFKRKGKKVFVAISDPLNIQPLDDMKLFYPDFEFIAILAGDSEIQRIIHTHYDVLKDETTDEVIEDLEESDFEILSSTISETEDILDMANEAPIIRLVNTIVKQAVTDRASDIEASSFGATTHPVGALAAAPASGNFPGLWRTV